MTNDKLAEIEAWVYDPRAIDLREATEHVQWLLDHVRTLEAQIREHLEECPTADEPRFDIDGMQVLSGSEFDKGVSSVLYIRCMAHREVPQYNRGENPTGGECPACAIEPLKSALEVLAADEHNWSGINCHDVHDIARSALALSAQTPQVTP